jgi:hypothetical protein
VIDGNGQHISLTIMSAFLDCDQQWQAKYDQALANLQAESWQANEVEVEEH